MGIESIYDRMTNTEKEVANVLKKYEIQNIIIR